MKILLTGASGFIGTRLQAALLQAGHELVLAGRHGAAGSGRCRWVEADMAATPPPRWAEHLLGVDAVVNAVGIFRESGASSFAALHLHGPVALFDACAAAGVQRVLQISALGADAEAATAYHRSKRAADAHLLALPLDSTVVQPSLVFGAEGASARGFLALAALPLLPLPAGGSQRVQPLHVDDAVAALCALLQAAPGRWTGRRVALVGPQALTLAGYLQALRQGLGLRPAATLSVPRPLVALAARIGDHLPAALLDSAAWQMLERGNSADAADTAALLGRPPRAAADFIAPGAAPGLRLQAQLGWLLPLLRLSLALVWLLTAAVSLGLYPVEQSLALLGRAGVPQALRPLALYGAAGLDLLLGVLTLWPFLQPARRRWLWMAQALLMGLYTLIISLRLPEFWLHPYGPLSKNLPMLGVLALLWTLDQPAHARQRQRQRQRAAR